MSQDKHFHQYGYTHYLRAPQRGFSVKKRGGLWVRVFGKHNRMAVVSLILLGGAVLFLGSVLVVYPSQVPEPKPVPIVKADLSRIKRIPDEPGGMSIPNAQSTVLARSEPGVIGGERGVENLLARKSEPLVMKPDALERAMSSPQNVEEASVQGGVLESDAEKVLQKLSSDAESSVVVGFEERVAAAAVAVKPRHKKMHAPGQSPETLQFVRRVLNDEQAVSAVEPAAGAAKPAAIASGEYYVQLASITDRGRADTEWSKMQAKYGALGGAEYRVQQASLNSGTFYRIQAGPMSKADADRICGDLKAAGKPGGCLVVK